MEGKVSRDSRINSAIGPLNNPNKIIIAAEASNGKSADQGASCGTISGLGVSGLGVSTSS